MIRKNRATQSVTHLDHPTMSIRSVEIAGISIYYRYFLPNNMFSM